MDREKRVYLPGWLFPLLVAFTVIGFFQTIVFIMNIIAGKTWINAFFKNGQLPF